MMKILALSGSLRAASINSAFLHTVVQLAPADMQVKFHHGIGTLPLFNPDLESELPESVAHLYTNVAAADVLLIASPEYAHGVTGTIKNALDWLVSCEMFYNKRVAVINTSPRAHHADDALKETLRTMSALVIEQACIGIPLLGTPIPELGMAELPWVRQAIHDLFSTLRLAA